VSATNLDLITSALRKLNVIDETEAPSAEQGVQGLAAVNDMMADMYADGIRLGWFPQTDLSATAPIADENIRGVKYLLTVELGGEYDLQVPQYVLTTAANAYARLAKGSQQYFEASMDGLPMGDAQYGWGWGWPFA